MPTKLCLYSPRWVLCGGLTLRMSLTLEWGLENVDALEVDRSGVWGVDNCSSSFNTRSSGLALGRRGCRLGTTNTCPTG